MTLFPFIPQSKARQTLKLHNKAGVTLLELIVTCALTVIFMGGVATVLPTALKLYNQVRGITYAQQVGGVVMNKIRGELETAQNGSVSIVLDAEGKGSAIKLKNRNGNNLSLTLTDAANADAPRWYVEKYEGYEIKQSGGGGDTVIISPVDWTFDESTYMGFFVSEMTFSKAKDNIYLVNLKLKSEKYGEYQFEEYVKMYHYSEQSECHKLAIDLMTDFLNKFAGGAYNSYTDIQTIGEGVPVSNRGTTDEAITAALSELGKHARHAYYYMTGDKKENYKIECFAFCDGKECYVYENGKWSEAKKKDGGGFELKPLSN